MMKMYQKNLKTLRICFLHKSDISVAGPIEVQIDELGDNIIIMYQFIGETNDTKIGGLESLLNYMNEIFPNKNDPAVNEHHYHITRKQYNQDFTTHNIYNVDKSKSYKTKITTLMILIFIIKRINHKQFNELHNQENNI